MAHSGRWAIVRRSVNAGALAVVLSLTGYSAGDSRAVPSFDYQLPLSLPVSATARLIAHADLNGDGKEDLILAGASAGMRERGNARARLADSGRQRRRNVSRGRDDRTAKPNQGDRGGGRERRREAGFDFAASGRDGDAEHHGAGRRTDNVWNGAEFDGRIWTSAGGRGFERRRQG